MMEDQARLMAERIARRVAGGPATPQTDISSELAAMRASLNDLQNRLVQIEAKVSVPRVHGSIPVWNALALKKPQSQNLSITFKTRKLAAWNLVGSLVTIARCVAREVFSHGFSRMNTDN
jgi:hypothetical protein